MRIVTPIADASNHCYQERPSGCTLNTTPVNCVIMICMPMMPTKMPRNRKFVKKPSNTFHSSRILRAGIMLQIYMRTNMVKMKVMCLDAPSFSYLAY